MDYNNYLILEIICYSEFNFYINQKSFFFFFGQKVGFLLSLFNLDLIIVILEIIFEFIFFIVVQNITIIII